MSLLIPMIPALLALAGMAVTLKAPHPAARGLGAAVAVGVFAGMAVLVAAYGYEEFAVLFAIAAAALVALGVASVREARRLRRPRRSVDPAPRPRPVLAERRYDIGGHTFTIEDGPGGRTVVERGNGLLVAVVRSEQDLAFGESLPMVAAAAADRYRDAEYVSSLYGSASSARADLAVDNILGGAL